MNFQYKLNHMAHYFGKLGKKQKEILRLLFDGWKFQIFTEFSAPTSQCEQMYLIDQEAANTQAVPKRILISFCKRELVEAKTVYSTVGPDTETVNYSLKPEFIEPLKRYYNFNQPNHE